MQSEVKEGDLLPKKIKFQKFPGCQWKFTTLGRLNEQAEVLICEYGTTEWVEICPKINQQI